MKSDIAYFMNISVQRGQNENTKKIIKQSYSIWKQEITDCVQSSES